MDSNASFPTADYNILSTYHGNSSMYDNESFPFDNYIILSSYVMNLVVNDHVLMNASFIVMCVIICLGYIANIFLIGLIVYNRKVVLKTAVNVLVLTLAVGDVAALTAVTTIEICFGILPENHDAYIKIKTVAISAAGVYAAAIVCFLTCLQFIAVYFPFKATMWLKKRTAGIMTSIAIVATIGSILPLWVLSARMRKIKVDNKYTDTGLFTGILYMQYSTILKCVTLGFTSCVIFIIHPLIIYRLCRRGSIGKRDKYRKAAKHIITMLIVFIFYLGLTVSTDMTWYGLAANDVISRTPVPKSVDNLLRYTVFLSEPLAILHIVFNPLIYALTTENYIQLYMPVFCRKTSSSASSTS